MDGSFLTEEFQIILGSSSFLPLGFYMVQMIYFLIINTTTIKFWTKILGYYAWVVV
jgi:hypothetical protein